MCDPQAVKLANAAWKYQFEWSSIIRVFSMGLQTGSGFDCEVGATELFEYSLYEVW